MEESWNLICHSETTLKWYRANPGAAGEMWKLGGKTEWRYADCDNVEQLGNVGLFLREADSSHDLNNEW